ncbi:MULTISPECIES: flagellar hook-associated protein FlgL [unclassified Paraburkholderia]|uniref:flagellar hook-associated protein FlgL n=1 Tax=unclassified Paraburkholderia TaxID=2615204 RepID=UPI00161B6D9C|nr:MULTISPECIES: flagellar hook-associated protein FlgL [unclassified Paraburkholderia]MBB5446033.1 flagellar hook-associated protein 3 FlgL [Paraburkholderia sp. WSM4177]MBB5486536.1 flagellar hook-associated protein 3 FlgL [Paraburkholderia sp. WSM4180]
MRISTQQYFSMNVANMSNQQAQLSQIYQEISSGQSLTTPADNPLGAAQAVQLSSTASALSQYTTNQNAALTSLQAEDSTLSTVITTLQSANTLGLRAGDGGLNDADRTAIAAQLTTLRDQLVTYANSTDSSGNALFAGFQNSTQAFTTDAAGNVTYTGDTGTRTVQVTDSNAVSTGDNGLSVFMSVGATNAQPIASGDPANTGTGVIGAVSVNDPTNAGNADSYQIKFSGSGSSLTYTVTDTTTGVAGTVQPYTAGSGITIAGQTVEITGTPAANDKFTVQPANQAGTNVFANLNAMIAALQQPVSGNPAASAKLQNSLNTGLSQLGNTLNNVTAVQASVGGREQEVKALQTVTETNSLQTQSDLADLTQTDMVSTISKYTMEQAALQASQQAFVQIQNMSLFQYING